MLYFSDAVSFEKGRNGALITDAGGEGLRIRFYEDGIIRITLRSKGGQVESEAQDDTQGRCGCQ